MPSAALKTKPQAKLPAAMSREPVSAAPVAAELVKAHGERQTQARKIVMQALLDAPSALTRQELEAQIGPGVLNRVTLYRVLDWLTHKGLARKVTGADRTWRFMAGEQAGQDHRHPHFRCTRCAGMTCLAPMKLPGIHLPADFQMEDLEVTVSGVCGNCARQA